MVNHEMILEDFKNDVLILSRLYYRYYDKYNKNPEETEIKFKKDLSESDLKAFNNSYLFDKEFTYSDLMMIHEDDYEQFTNNYIDSYVAKLTGLSIEEASKDGKLHLDENGEWCLEPDEIDIFNDFALVSIDEPDKILCCDKKSKCMEILSGYVENGHDINLYNIREIKGKNPIILGDIVF